MAKYKERIVSQKKKKIVLSEERDLSAAPRTLRVTPTVALTSVVPKYILRLGKIDFKPTAFGTESPRLKQRFIEDYVQKEGLIDFINDPRSKIIYGVGGAPDDAVAKYFAAYLVYRHQQAVGTHKVIWDVFYDRTTLALIQGDVRPTMLVLTNLTPSSSSYRLERARDLLERFPNIPRVVVCAGEDPVSFISTRLYQPIHSCAYFISSHVKRIVEVD